MATLTAETHGKKAMVVTGDTMLVKELLKELGGSWHKELRGWVFPGAKKDEVLEDLEANSQIKEVKCVEGPAGWAFPGSKKDKKQSPTVGTGGGSAAKPQVMLGRVGGSTGSSRKNPAGLEADAPLPKRVALAAQPEGSSKLVVELTDPIRATVCVLDDGSFGVDIRKFHSDAGVLVPTQKGVCLTGSEWKALCGAMDKINIACKGSEPEAKVKVTSDFVVIVRTERNSTSVELQREGVSSTKRGLRMAVDRWAILRSAADRISKAVDGSTFQAVD